MNVRGTDFVLYEVADFDGSVRFYRDTLGLKMTMLMDNEQFKWAEFDLVQTTLGICPPMGPNRDGPAPGGTVFLAVDDVAASIEELRAKGVRILYGPHESPVCFMGAILDPSGNCIGLHHRKDGTVG